MINRCLATTFALVLAYGLSATAQPLNDGVYLCTKEFSGGLAYDAKTKKWHSTTFKPDGKFVLRLKYTGQIIEKTFGSEKIAYYQYDIMLTPAGTSEEYSCIDPGGRKTVSIRDRLYFRCGSLSGYYAFDLQNNRFLQAYLEGYVGGRDNNDDTPFVAGGTCSKIQ